MFKFLRIYLVAGARPNFMKTGPLSTYSALELWDGKAAKRVVDIH